MATKICVKCNKTKPTTEFFRSKWNSSDGLDYYCKPCRRGLYQVWAKNNPEETKRHRRECYRRLKADVIKAYGSKCNCCGETIEAFLALDHVNGGGNKHRKLSGGNQAPYRDARNRNFPPDYQLLCHNCNWAKHFLGRCPHQDF